MTSVLIEKEGRRIAEVGDVNLRGSAKDILLSRKRLTRSLVSIKITVGLAQNSKFENIFKKH